MKIHKEGWWYCLTASIIYFVVLVALAQLFPHWSVLFFIGAFLFGLIYFWVFWFFRIPNKNFTNNDNYITSPCDGKVVVIEEAVETEYYKDKRIQVSVFMSPLNVHNNLYPISGDVQYVQYHKGKYLVAWHPKSSTENERSTIVVANAKTTILIRQIAGAVARRIVTYSKAGDTASQNSELGFIKFGSRVDIYLPLGTTITAKIGDVVTGGVSVLAQL